ncbi:excisionase family DNA-binding protein [Cytobacillus spongiae]|uniref:excisionase family DNA-binding protein n=1 Tax=Cytobacillus spongiae TaxID=2901381 RepID=UPI001F345620|nr:excisionase family DNA-binding protein [Cytobacillus spongiae]UII56243.1 excisionase family DNA-binding protein [Cytobacillus spongiae]
MDNFRLELPEGTILINGIDSLREMLVEVQRDSVKEVIITIREAAEYLKVNVPIYLTMIVNNKIPFFQRGQVIRLNRWDVKEWLCNRLKQ